MMSLKETLTQQLKSAMKTGDKIRLETLRSIRAAMLEREIHLRGTGKEMTPEEELVVLSAVAKKRRESIEQFQKGGREDLVTQETLELEIIQEYLPKQLSEEEIRAVILDVIRESGGSEFSKVMPHVMKQVKGKADGRLVQELVKKTIERL